MELAEVRVSTLEDFRFHRSSNTGLGGQELVLRAMEAMEGL